MTPRAYKQGIYEALRSLGFIKRGNSLYRDQQNVLLLLSVEGGKSHRWYINLGFWLKSLGETTTDRVEKTHIYIRLERLFPMYRDIILASSALGEPDQPIGYERLIELLLTEIDRKLRSLSTEEGLKAALREGRFSHAISLPEARKYLEHL